MIEKAATRCNWPVVVPSSVTILPGHILSFWWFYLQKPAHIAAPRLSCIWIWSSFKSTGQIDILAYSQNTKLTICIVAYVLSNTYYCVKRWPCTGHTIQCAYINYFFFFFQYYVIEECIYNNMLEYNYTPIILYALAIAIFPVLFVSPSSVTIILIDIYLYVWINYVSCTISIYMWYMYTKYNTSTWIDLQLTSSTVRNRFASNRIEWHCSVFTSLLYHNYFTKLLYNNYYAKMVIIYQLRMAFHWLSLHPLNFT